jgi:hypothetical protein
MTALNTTLLIAGLGLTLVGIVGRQMKNMRLRFGLQLGSIVGILALIIVFWVAAVA